MAGEMIYNKISGTWHSTDQVYVNQSGTWHDVNDVWVKQGSIWRKSFTKTVPPITIYEGGTPPNGLTYAYPADAGYCWPCSGGCSVGCYQLHLIPSFFMKTNPVIGQIGSFTTGAGNKWTISGNYASEFSAGNTIVVTGNSNGPSNKQYIVVSSTNNGLNTDIVVNGSTIPVASGNNGTLSLPQVKLGTQTATATLNAYVDYGFNLWYSVNGGAWNWAGQVYDAASGQHWRNGTFGFGLTVPSAGNVRWAHSAGNFWQNFYLYGSINLVLPNT